MARFYNTSRTDFGDYIDEFSQRRKPGAESVSSALGGIDVLPEDRGRLEEIVNGYDQKINDFTRQIQQNPSVLPTLKGQMQDVGQNLRNDFFYGEIAAMRDRVKTHKEKVDYINEALKDDPQLQSLALQRIQVNPLDYDPATRTYGKVDAPTVVAPFTQKEKQDWATKAASTVKEDILSRVDKTRKLDKYTSLLELGEEVGVTKDKAIESLVSQVTPDMIRSEQQKAD